MGLLSFFQRKAPQAAKASADMSVQQLRVRARRRLIGAAVLVGLGVIGFPLVFETQPRPIPVDLPIDIPRKEAAAALVIPPSAATAPLAAAPSSVPQATGAISPVDTSGNSGRPAAVTAAAEVRPESRPADKPAEATDKPIDKAATKAAPRPSEKPVDKHAEKPAEKVKPASPAPESARVQALLDGKAAAASSAGGKFVVQVGAYADSKAAQEARMKLERMGLKTYVQTVDTAGGKRIRVRVGPYTSRDEADKVASKVRGSGLSTAVLTL